MTENLNLKTVDTVDTRPFKKLVMTIGELPTSFIESMTYYELLAWFTNYLETVIIPTVNNNAEAVEELQALFTELKTFVDTYFDNLDVQDEIDHKLDEMVEDGTFTELIAEYAETKVDYYRLTPTSTMQEIKDAFLGRNRAKVIEFEKGTYTLSEQVALTSNTKVLLNGSTLQSSYTDTYGDNIVFLAVDADVTGYDGVHNFEIVGGIVDTGFVFMHANNVTFNSIEFGDSITSHAIQIAGCSNFTVKNCIFNGTVINDTNGKNHECIQMETCNHSGQPYLPDGSTTYDHTGCNNIIISNCIFNNGDEVTTRNYTSIGGHATDANNRLAQKNIIIERCKFKTNHYCDIRLLEVKGGIIRNNTFDQVNEYSDQNSIRVSWQNQDILIEDNEWISTRSGISSANQEQRNNFTIRNNKINANIGATPNCISCYNTNNLTIENNELKSLGVCVYTKQDTNLTQNNIKITNNKFDLTNSTSAGIKDNGGDNFYITNNTCLQSATTSPFTDCGATKKVLYANNTIINETTTAVNNFDRINDYTNVYNTSVIVYNGAATYSAITGGTLSSDVTKFNTLLLTVHADGSTNNGVETIEVKPFELKQKIDARKYNVIFSNGSNGTKYGQLTITNGTTFNWTSSDSLVLRKIYAFNQVLQ